jgi:hypothetical protein
MSRTRPGSPTSAEIRQARAFLYKRGARTVPPDEFAGTAKDMALTFAELWKTIWEENMGCSNRSDEERGSILDAEITEGENKGKTLGQAMHESMQVRDVTVEIQPLTVEGEAN